VLYGVWNVYPFQNVIHIVCHPFKKNVQTNVSNIRACILKIQKIKKIFKKNAIWDESIKKAQP
jgi:hypothetical protein